MIRLFNDSLSLLNNRTSLIEVHAPSTVEKTVYKIPTCNVGTPNLLVFIDGKLTRDYKQISMESIEFNAPIVNQQVIAFYVRTGGDYLNDKDEVSEIRQLYHGVGPPTITGKVDDYYIDTEGGGVYSKNSEGYWLSIAQIGVGWTQFNI